MRAGNYQGMEKRESVRLEKTLPVEFRLPEVSGRTGPFEALSRNIGNGGIFIETDLIQDQAKGLNKDTLIDLEIDLLGQAQRIRPRGRVVWISRKSRSPQKQRSGIGIKFIQINAREQQAISFFISKERLVQTETIEKEIPTISREQKLTDRQRRNLEILNAVRKHGLISRAEISKNTGINIVTVSNYIDNYLKKSLVFERGLDISTGGRRPELLEINPDYGYVVGVDVGPLSLEQSAMQAVVCDFSSRVKIKKEVDRVGDDIGESLPLIKNLIADAVVTSGVTRTKIKGIGIGVSGILDKFSGTISNPYTGTTFANYIMAKKELEDEFALPVLIESNAACALFAEKWSGISLEAKEADNIIYLFSPDQCAIMLRGELYTGLNKSAGQLYLSLPRNNSAGSNYTQQTNNYCWLDSSADCLLHLRGKNSAGDEEPFDSLGARMGAKIAFLVNLFNPQVVIIGTYFNHLGDGLLDTIRRTVNRLATREVANILRIISASLEEEAVVSGATSLVIESAFANI